jgi:HEPN domain-containing protein
MTDPEPADITEMWLWRVRSDLHMGGAALITQGVMIEDACFHAQQSAEKALKGLLTYLKLRIVNE